MKKDDSDEESESDSDDEEKPDLQALCEAKLNAPYAAIVPGVVPNDDILTRMLLFPASKQNYDLLRKYRRPMDQSTLWELAQWYWHEEVRAESIARNVPGAKSTLAKKKKFMLARMLYNHLHPSLPSA